MGDEVQAKRRCVGTTSAGKDCGMTPFKAPAEDGEYYCFHHHPNSGELKAKYNVGGPQAGSGRPKVMKATEMARAIVEASVMEWLRPYLDTVGLDVSFDDDGNPVVARRRSGGAKIVGMSKDGDVYVSAHEDLDAQIRAVEAVLNRVYGKPRQSHEVVGSGGGPVQIDVPRETDRAAQVAEVLRQAQAFPMPLPQPSEDLAQIEAADDEHDGAAR